jgi:hypothetical protein
MTAGAFGSGVTATARMISATASDRTAY